MKEISDDTHELLENLVESTIQNWDIDKELANDCFPLKEPYRTRATDALLTVETRMRKKLKLGRSRVGVDIVDDARRLGVFKRSDPSEEQGIQLLFRGSVKGMRNVLVHNKPEMNKQEAITIILFADYLIKLFETLCKENKIKP
ncbi:MAG: hypothetical protein NPMRTH1_1550027 [Nitrosopumilales archaeon]|nr:MAG: hypothetical protein NPMRTH1_1550027 [Nitrosopumilales archaeon]